MGEGAATSSAKTAAPAPDKRQVGAVESALAAPAFRRRRMSPIDRVFRAALFAMCLTLPAEGFVGHGAIADEAGGGSPAQDQPPVIKLPLAIVDPPRTQPAASWNSAFCARWDDGCTKCTRTQTGEPPQCEKEQGENEQAGQCNRRAIICFEILDESYFERICKWYFADILLKSRSGALYADGLALENLWEHVEGRWRIYEFDQKAWDDKWGVGPGKRIHTIDRPSVLSAITAEGYKDGRLGVRAHVDGPLSFAFGRQATGTRCIDAY